MSLPSKVLHLLNMTVVETSGSDRDPPLSNTTRMKREIPDKIHRKLLFETDQVPVVVELGLILDYGV